MFKVKIGEDEYEVTFEHEIPHKYDYEDMKPEDFRKYFGTGCTIDLLPERQIGWLAWSDLSIHDHFNREIGRKVSLTKALKQAFPYPADKENRKLFWQAYYEARGGKW